MLRVYKLICKDPKFYKGCKWTRTKLKYPDNQYQLLYKRLSSQVLRTGVACQIDHDEHGILAVLKRGHDNKLFPKEVGDLSFLSNPPTKG